MKKVYLVIHDGPCGSSIIGIYTTRDKAKRAKKRWDKAHSCDWDHATITKNNVDEKPVLASKLS